MKVSPEEKLFNIIQQEKSSPGPAVNSKKPDAQLIFQKIKSIFSSLIPHKGSAIAIANAGSNLSFAFNFHELDLPAINKLLTVVLAVTATLTAYFILSGHKDPQKIIQAMREVNISGVKIKNIESLEPLSSFTETILKRNIFKPGNNPVDLIKSGSMRLGELSKDLKLVGIYQGDIPEVMLEDTGLRKTYFLKEGQEVKGIMVKKISKDKIILSAGNEEMELH